MDSTPVTASSLETVEATLRDELAQGDAVLSTATPILRHLLANEEQALFGDEVIARVRGMLADLARQMLYAQAEAAGASDRAAYADERAGPAVRALVGVSPLLGHLHALTIEGQIARRLNARTGADMVLSPLLQELVAARDDAMAAAAMSAIAAQARFLQQQRPGFANALQRAVFDESQGRLGLLARLVMRMARDAPRALDVDHAGMAVFATALAMASGQGRDTTVLALSDRQFARLALALRAAGLKQAAVEEQFLYLHPDVDLPPGFETLRSDRAAALLAASPLVEG